MAEHITLYSNKACPYAHRVEIALQELGISFARYEIDLQNKPDWYAERVNPAGKVPAIAFGGPVTPPERPSPESAKLFESLILLEFLADLFPHSSLLPTSPVARAKVRLFIDAVTTKLVPAWTGLLLQGAGPEPLLAAASALQALLETDGGVYAVGDLFTIADAAVAPFLARVEVSLRHDVGVYDPGVGKKTLQALEGEKYATLWAYFRRLKERESFKKTFDESVNVQIFHEKMAQFKAQQFSV